MEKKLISLVTPCYNEEGNVAKVYEQVKVVIEGQLNNYDYEHIFIDNASTDNTVEILKDIAKNDKNVKIIVNSRNFGHIRSPVYAMMQASGDVVVSLVADLQDPPEMLPIFLEKWSEGYDVVYGIRKKRKENILKRSSYYWFYRML